MIKKTILKEIQQRLPKEIRFFDETNFEFSDDELISVLSWIKYFNIHYKNFELSCLPEIIRPIISKRLLLDFGLYNKPDSIGEYVIYLVDASKGLRRFTLRNAIDHWCL